MLPWSDPGVEWGPQERGSHVKKWSLREEDNPYEMKKECVHSLKKTPNLAGMPIIVRNRSHAFEGRCWHVHTRCRSKGPKALEIDEVKPQCCGSCMYSASMIWGINSTRD